MNRKTKFAAIVALSIAGWAFSADAAAHNSIDKSKGSKSGKTRLIEENRDQLKKQEPKKLLRKQLDKETLPPGKLERIAKEKERRQEEGKKELVREVPRKSRTNPAKDVRLEKAAQSQKKDAQSKGK